VHFHQVKRGEFFTLLGGAAAAWPLAARAQQAGMPLIGWLHSGPPAGDARQLAAFRDGVKEAGFTEGQNLGIEYRWAENQLDRLPELAADLAHRDVSLIAACGSPAVALAAKSATSSIPIVFENGADAVQLGLVASLARPGGNVTGVTSISTELMAKRMGLLRDLNAAFQTMAQLAVGGLVMATDALFNNLRDQIIALAKNQSIPTIYEFSYWAAAGGLISYGPDNFESYRRAGTLAGRILRGAKPADLPVILPTKFELVINMKTAKALGIEVPVSMQLLADEVIE
jgi:putative ABC transport system substrate-binding protein